MENDKKFPFLEQLQEMTGEKGEEFAIGVPPFKVKRGIFYPIVFTYIVDGIPFTIPKASLIKKKNLPLTLQTLFTSLLKMKVRVTTEEEILSFKTQKSLNSFLKKRDLFFTLNKEKINILLSNTISEVIVLNESVLLHSNGESVVEFKLLERESVFSKCFDKKEDEIHQYLMKKYLR